VHHHHNNHPHRHALLQEEERAAAAANLAAIRADQAAMFTTARPCALCAECTGFVVDDFAPALCSVCGHLRVRHNDDAARGTAS